MSDYFSAYTDSTEGILPPTLVDERVNDFIKMLSMKTRQNEKRMWGRIVRVIVQQNPKQEGLIHDTIILWK